MLIGLLTQRAQFSSLAALRIEAQDRVRFDPRVRNLLCRLQLARDAAHPADGPQSVGRSVVRLCAAARLAATDALLKRVERRIAARLALCDATRLDLREFVPRVIHPRIPKAVILKPYVSERERGVVFIAFEDQWAQLVHNCDLHAFARRYKLVVAPVWSPPHGLLNYLLPAVYPDRIYSLISITDDLVTIPRMSAKYVMVPLLSSSWVNPDLYRPLPPAEKDIDIVMLANFAKYKRHHVLFKALQDMPRPLRVVLIGYPNGRRTSATLLAEARAYGVEGRFELIEAASHDTLSRHLARARISLILSRREGSCVAVVESLFANTPVGLLDDAAVGSRQFINSHTGRFLRHDDLADQLMDFLSHSGGYEPRAWALDHNVSCVGSTAVLNDVLRSDAIASGEQWTQDVAVHHWRWDPRLFSQEDRRRMQPAYDDLQERFGVTLFNTAASEVTA